MSARTLCAVVCLLIAAPLPAHSQQADSTTVEILTLEQAVALALRDNRQVRQAGLEVGKFEDRIAATRTRRLPEFKLDVMAGQLLTPFDFRFEKGALGTYPDLGPIPDTTTTIRTSRQPTAVVIGQVNQPLSQLYRIGLNLKSLEIGKEIAGQRVRTQNQTIVNQVKRAYYALLQTNTTLQAASESIRLYEELDRVTGEHVLQQVALKSESLDVKMRLEQSRYEALTLGDQLASQKEQLNQLLGRDIRTEFTVTPVSQPSNYEVDLTAARERALAQRPEAAEARLKVQQAEYDRRIKKSEYLPDVSLSLTYLSPQSINSIPKQIASAGIMVSWEPFDWGRKKRELAEKSKTIDQASTSLRDTEERVLLEVNDRFRKVQQARQLVVIGRLAEEAAREQLRVRSNRYAVQAALLKDVLLAQTSLADAHSQYQQALHTFWTARADFEKALGDE